MITVTGTVSYQFEDSTIEEVYGGPEVSDEQLIDDCYEVMYQTPAWGIEWKVERS